VLDVLAQHYREVAGSGDQHVVEAFAAQCADPALGDRVRSRCANWCADDADVGAGEDCVEGGGELGVPVADQEPELVGAVAEVHQQVAGLLGHPGAVDDDLGRCKFINDPAEGDRRREGADSGPAPPLVPAQCGDHASGEAVVDSLVLDELSVDDLTLPQPGWNRHHRGPPGVPPMSRVTIGPRAFVHYAVILHERAVIDADAFLMNGQEVPRVHAVEGNPAAKTRDPRSTEPTTGWTRPRAAHSSL
jgi:hypothetical protein